MIPVEQSILMDDVPAGKAMEAVARGRAAGDCMRACVASILELPLDEVPHFVQYCDHPEGTDSHLWWWALVGFCAAHGWRVSYVEEPPPGWSIAAGTSTRGHGHVVVVCHGRIEHDPHPSGHGLAGDPDGYYAFMKDAS